MYVDGRRRVTDRRIARATRDRPVGEPLAGLIHDLQWCTQLRRYVDGQRQYHDACAPLAGADLVVINDDLEQPLVRTRDDHVDSRS